jgi:hypothetical protein
MRSGRLLFSKVGEAGVNETFFTAAAEEACIGARFCASVDSATDSREMKTKKSARKTASADLIFTMTLLTAPTSRLFLVDLERITDAAGTSCQAERTTVFSISREA